MNHPNIRTNRDGATVIEVGDCTVTVKGPKNSVAARRVVNILKGILDGDVYETARASACLADQLKTIPADFRG